MLYSLIRASRGFSSGYDKSFFKIMVYDTDGRDTYIRSTPGVQSTNTGTEEDRK